MPRCDLALEIYRPRDYNPKRVEADRLHAEVKEDGRWTRITTVDGGLRVHGHRISDITGLPEYLDLPEDIVPAWVKVLPETAVDGELIWPGHPATSVITAIKECPGVLEFHGFAVPKYRGVMKTHVGWEEMRDLTAEVSELLTDEDGVFDRDGDGDMPSVEAILEHVKSHPTSIEGLVLKGYGYYDWWKVKPVKTIDVVVIALKPGTGGKWQHHVGSLTVAVYDCDYDNHHTEQIILGDVSGMDDATRLAITRADIGRVCEVEYQDIAAQGKLKFPRFMRWRDDKGPEGCPATQIPGWHRIIDGEKNRHPGKY
jgi:hypothetical protein